MSVKKEASGRRSVQVEVEVPGTPEEVWQAIATGPGISAWFVPTEFVEQGGKPVAVTMNFGPGMESTSKIAEWDPPRMFAAQGEGWGGSPPMATEWSVEARAGGNCLVRVVHSLFASTDDWDNQLEGTEHGWPSYFRILHLYLTHFRGQRCTSIQVMASGSKSGSKAWDALTTGLGVQGVSVGQRWTAPAGVPAASGIVEPLGPGQHPNNILVTFGSADDRHWVVLRIRLSGHGDGVGKSLSVWRQGEGRGCPRRTSVAQVDGREISNADGAEQERVTR